MGESSLLGACLGTVNLVSTHPLFLPPICPEVSHFAPSHVSTMMLLSYTPQPWCSASPYAGPEAMEQVTTDEISEPLSLSESLFLKAGLGGNSVRVTNSGKHHQAIES